MAGAGYKLFATGDVLTAAQVNTYLNEQTVMVFASSAARTSALTAVLAEGMVSYLQDTNAVEVYNGTAWVGVSGAGDVTEVQAGVGISVASGTGPIPVITNSSTDLITTAGDILYGTAADTVARLGIGTAGQVLKVNSGATAPEWGAAGGGGKVLQLVQGSTTTATSVSTNTYTDSTLTASITPTLNTSKILVCVTQLIYLYRNTTAGAQGDIRLMRGATAIGDFGNSVSGGLLNAALNGTVNELIHWVGINYLDEPATTSSTTYKTQIRTENSTIEAQLNSVRSTITLFEIGA